MRSTSTTKLVTQELRLNSDFNFPLIHRRPVFRALGSTVLQHAGPLSGVRGFRSDREQLVDDKCSRTRPATRYSVFGQARWDIIPNLELAAGVRYTYDKKELKVENLTVNPGSAGLGINLYPVGQVIDSRYGDQYVSPDVTLTWTPSPARRCTPATRLDTSQAASPTGLCCIPMLPRKTCSTGMKSSKARRSATRRTCSIKGCVSTSPATTTSTTACRWPRSTISMEPAYLRSRMRRPRPRRYRSGSQVAGDRGSELQRQHRLQPRTVFELSGGGML